MNEKRQTQNLHTTITTPTLDQVQRMGYNMGRKVTPIERAFKSNLFGEQVRQVKSDVILLIKLN